ncbi:Asp23/Gls24 family envelope stress response protein [uncultured Leuconostoc sp.]|uniref:Asp23/Gls24 family envelope stress response protein n=1 Tax=uncultured Leuconostoc sp. TaxID=173262 RepID=UPI0025F28B12|nr:Asp23/Gls24 family envelope stress response protein [uncultured Leuconostoc sp.]
MAREIKRNKQTAKNIILATENSDVGGTTQVTPEVIEVVAQIATQEVHGVYSMRGTLSDRFTNAFGSNARGKGVELSHADEGLVIDVYVFLQYGVVVPKVALEIQHAIQSQISSMTDLQVTQINVHVTGIVPEKISSSIDPDNLFGESGITEVVK